MLPPNEIARLVVVGPSLVNLKQKKETYLECTYNNFDGPMSDMELQLAVWMDKPVFSVSDFFREAITMYDMFKTIRFKSLKRPYKIIARYPSPEHIIQIDPETYRKAVISQEEADAAIHEYHMAIYDPQAAIPIQTT